MGKFEDIQESYAKNLGQAFLPRNMSNIKQNIIEDLPILITRDGTVVCIPKLKEMGLITYVGLTGMGKTLAAGGGLDEIYWNWGDNLSIMNDSQDETFQWSEPNDVDAFVSMVKKINLKPKPLPIVYLFPSSDEFIKQEENVKNKDSIIISIPFSDVINNIEKYVPNLGESKKYLLERRDELLKVETTEELFSLIDSIDNGTSKGLKDVVKKLTAGFSNLIQEGILNISNPSIPSYLKTNMDEKLHNPFVAIMKCECVPSFVTSDLYTQKYKDAILSYYIDELYYECSQGELKGKRVWLYFDELTWVVHSDPRKTSPETESSLSNIASRGRNNGISLVYATQSYNDIPRAIRSQTKFAVIFRHKDREQAKGICDDFGLGKVNRDDILGLKKYEAIVATTEYLVCYKGETKKVMQGPFVGTVFPALHKNRFLRKVD